MHSPAAPSPAEFATLQCGQYSSPITKVIDHARICVEGYEWGILLRGQGVGSSQMPFREPGISLKPELMIQHANAPRR